MIFWGRCLRGGEAAQTKTKKSPRARRAQKPPFKGQTLLCFLLKPCSESFASPLRRRLKLKQRKASAPAGYKSHRSKDKRCFVFFRAPAAHTHTAHTHAAHRHAARPRWAHKHLSEDRPCFIFLKRTLRMPPFPPQLASRASLFYTEKILAAKTAAPNHIFCPARGA